MNTNISRIALIAGIFALLFSSCYDVSEGYRIDYDESSATFEVTNLGYDYGAIDDTIKYHVVAQSNTFIKSLITESSISGSEGTGFDTITGGEDPFIDHAYGTLQDSVQNIDLYYYYIIGQDSADVEVDISIVDEEGMKTCEIEIYTVPSITRYDSIDIYTQTSAKADGFSTYDGTVYHYLPDYEDLTEDNVTVQESLDIVFLVSNSEAMLVAPYNGNFSTSMSVVNKTIFKQMSSVSSETFDNLTNSSLAYYADVDSVSKGTTYVSGIEVGDIIGFRTDYASTNSYAYGMVRVNAIHPTNSEWYDGKCYLMEMDVVTQISDDDE